MSHYGTHPEYQRGWDDGCEEERARHKALVQACNDLLRRWGTNKNLGESVQAVAAELRKLGK